MAKHSVCLKVALASGSYATCDFSAVLGPESTQAWTRVVAETSHLVHAIWTHFQSVWCTDFDIVLCMPCRPESHQAEVSTELLGLAQAAIDGGNVAAAWPNGMSVIGSRTAKAAAKALAHGIGGFLCLPLLPPHCRCFSLCFWSI